MKKRNDKQVISGPYVQNQLSLLPQTYDELVPKLFTGRITITTSYYFVEKFA